MEKLDFNKFVERNKLFYIQYGRGAVIVAYDKTNKLVSDLVCKSHNIDDVEHFIPVNEIEFLDGEVRLELIYREFSEGIYSEEEIIVTKYIPASQVSFESYL